MDRLTRRAVLAGAGGALAGLAGCLGSGGGSGTTPAGTDGDGGTGGEATWRTADLTDVRTGESFRIAELPKPLLLETFAVWCSKCLRQQRTLTDLQDRLGDEFTSVALNVDPNEDAERVRRHVEKHGFDWRYAVSPPPVTDALVAEFGETMTVPPRVPVVVVCEDGARRLPDGQKSVDELATALDEGC